MTPRETDILALLAGGKITTNRAIAAQLCLSNQVVKNYITSLLRKTGTHNRTELAVRAAIEEQGGLLIFMRRQ